MPVSLQTFIVSFFKSQRNLKFINNLITISISVLILDSWPHMYALKLITVGVLMFLFVGTSVIDLPQHRSTDEIDAKDAQIAQSLQQIVRSAKEMNEKSNQPLEQLWKDMNSDKNQKPNYKIQNSDSTSRIEEDWGPSFSFQNQDTFIKSIIAQIKNRESFGGLTMITDSITSSY